MDAVVDVRAMLERRLAKLIVGLVSGLPVAEAKLHRFMHDPK